MEVPVLGRDRRVRRRRRLLVIVYLSIRVVQQYEKMVVFRLGRTNESMVRDPGLRFLVPIIDRPVKVDVREQFIEVPSQTTITRDNAPINVDFLIYWRISDPLKSVVNVVNFPGALQGVATTTLRAVIGDILLDEVLSKREQINEVLRVKLDEVTERWGGKVTTVEIREITPPRDVQDAMNRQLSAERTRRAVITESEGSRQAAINVAEGQKQAEILKAEGERQAAILRAEGFSQALTRIYGAAAGIDAEDDGAPVPRGAQGARRQPGDEVRHPDRVHPPARAVRRLRRARAWPADDGGPRPQRIVDPPARRSSPASPPLPAAVGRLVDRRAARDRLLDAPRTTPRRGGARPGARRARRRGRPAPIARRPAARRPLAAGRCDRSAATRRGRPTRTRRSCCSTAGRARSRRTSSSTARSCAGRPACSASTSAATASRTTRRRRSGCTRSRTSPARWPGSASGGSRASRCSGRRWAAITALASVVVLGDGSLPSADLDPDAPAARRRRAAAADRGRRRRFGRRRS